MIYLRLFWEFFKVGLFSVGGGMATFPFLSAISARTGWFTQEQLTDMIAISEATPGPIGINSATYVGFTTAGLCGSVMATLGLICPSVLVILLIAKVLSRFRDNPGVKAAFYGLRPASTGLIAAAGFSVTMLSLTRPEYFGSWKQLSAFFRWPELALAAVLLVLTRWVKPTKKLHPAVWIALSAAVGIAFRFAGV